MKIEVIALLLCCGLFGWAHAQTIVITGIVKDIQTNHAIPFASLGIKGKNAGTIADEIGAFHFFVDSGTIAPSDEIVISCVGYSPASIPISKFKRAGQIIELMALSTELKAVNVKPGKYKTKVFGRTGSGTIMTANMFTERNLVSDNLGKEQATILSIEKQCYLRDFNMLVVFNRFESIKFRLNFYSVKDGRPDRLIVNQNILFDVTTKAGWHKVDLTPYNIYLNGFKEIAVAIQWVKSVKIDTAIHAAFGVSVKPVPFHAMYFRNKSQADWEKVSPAYLAFNITADSFKQDKGNATEEELVPQERPSIIGDSIRNFAAYTQFAHEASASGYGNNPNAGRYLNLADGKLYYEVYGGGRPLVLLHGNGASISSFYKQIPELAKRYQVIAVDTRAQGRSIDASTTQLSYNKFALDVKQLLDSLNIRQASILGWSDGGNTGLILAATYPSYVNKLVTAGAVLSPQGVEPGLLNHVKATLGNMAGNEAIKPSAQQRLLTLLLNEPNITLAELENIKIPVLVVSGEKDVVLPEHTKLIADHIKQSELIILNGATHYAPQEKPVEFNSEVIKFLDR